MFLGAASCFVKSVFFRPIVFAFYLGFVFSLFFSSQVSAQVIEEALSDPILKKNVMFWHSIYTKYGKDDVVIHHRKKPWIIYDVLRLASLEAGYTRAELNRNKRIIGDRINEVSRELKLLAGGKSPKSRLGKFIAGTIEGQLKGRAVSAAADKDNIRYQRGIKEKFKKGIERSRRYLADIERIFKQEGVPLEITRLPLVESSFNYKARSSVGAAGIWQFMPATGRLFNMTVNSRIDQRLDPLTATKAAAKYLRNSYEKTNSWPIAITSYNHGLNGMLRAMKQVKAKNFGPIYRKYKGRTFGFASKNFYTSFVAAYLVEQEASKHFSDFEFEDRFVFDEIKLPYSVSYRTLLKLSSLDKDDFRIYNLSLKKSITNGSYPVPKGYGIKVRKGEGERILSKLKNNKNEYVRAAPRFKTYRVRRGDTIKGIARRFGTTTVSIMALNGIINPNRIYVGQVLKVRGSSSYSTQRAKHSSSSPIVYKVRSGDTLSGIASKFGTSVSRIKANNPKIRSSRIYKGQKLKIYGAKKTYKSSSKRVYRVRKGDTMHAIAKKHGVSLGKLKRLNPRVNSRKIYPGQRLRVR